MVIQFYTERAFSKKPNSTKIPSDDIAYLTYECVLKDNCSITSPLIEIQLDSAANPAVLWYAFIPDFSRYYFVRDWSYYRGIWTATLDIDVLGSFTDEIKSTTQYVMRSATVGDGTIKDGLYPIATNPDLLYIKGEVQSPEGWTDSNTNFLVYSTGCFVVGIAGANATSDTGATCYYVMTPTEFRNFCSWLVGDSSTWLNISTDEISTELQKGLINPFQYIVSAIWYPLSVDNIPHSSSQVSIDFGWWTSSTSAYVTSTNPVVIKMRYALEKNPQAAEVGSYVNYQPFTQIELVNYPWGRFSIPCFALQHNYLWTIAEIDITTGNSKLTISADAAGTMPYATAYSAYGVAVQMTQVTNNTLGAGTTLLNGALSLVNTATSGIGNLIGGNPLGAIGSLTSAVGTIANTASSAVQELTPGAQKSGNNGSRVDYQSNFSTPVLIETFYHTVEQDPDHRGMLYCGRLALNTLGGYTEIADPDVESCGVLENEKNAIANFMLSGFYLE